MPYLRGAHAGGDPARPTARCRWPRALAIAEPILETLQHAHEHGLVHRDVKPDNILIEARHRPAAAGGLRDREVPRRRRRATPRPGFIVGTPLYMSPEQALGRQDVDARADVYGMGVVLFQMLTGAPPFEGDDSQEIVTRHLHEPVPVATLSRDRVPRLALGDHRPLPGQASRRPLSQRAGRARGAPRGPRRGVALPVRAGAPPRSEDETPTAAMPRAIARRAGRPAGGARWSALGLVAAVGRALGIGTAASATPRAGCGRRAPATRPALVVHNRLTEPIALTLDDTGFTVGAGRQPAAPAPGAASRSRPTGRWCGPSPPDGRMLGAALEGSHRERRGAGRRAARSSAPRPTGGGGSRPWWSTRRARPLSAAVVSGRDTADCGCSIAPGDSLRLGLLPARAGQSGPGARLRRGRSGASMLDPAAGRLGQRRRRLPGDRPVARPTATPPRDGRRAGRPRRGRSRSRGILPVR